MNKELDIVREELKKVSIHNENLNKLAVCIFFSESSLALADVMVINLFVVNR